MLLTEEEINAVDWFFDSMCPDIDQLLKVQLKRVVEMLQSCDGELISRNNEPFKVTFEVPIEVWLSLLEEVKE